MGVLEGCPLTAREFETVKVVAEIGGPLTVVAAARGVTHSTVRGQLVSARARVGVHSTHQLVMLAHERGWIDGPPPAPRAPPARTRRPRRAPRPRGRPVVPVSPAQSLYLAALAKYLDHKSPANFAEKAHMLRAMYYERGRLPPAPAARSHRLETHRGIE